VSRTDAAGIAVDVLVNNAGFGTHGDLIDADPQRLADEIQLNCATLVDLTARYLPGMRSRGRGTVVNIASTAGFQPVPHMAVYGATKAFVLSFSEALWAEEKPHGIRVLAVCRAPPTRSSSTSQANRRHWAGSAPRARSSSAPSANCPAASRVSSTACSMRSPPGPHPGHPRRLLITVTGRLMGGGN